MVPGIRIPTGYEDASARPITPDREWDLSGLLYGGKINGFKKRDNQEYR